MLDYTEDFKKLYTKLLYNFISLKVNEEAFNNKIINLDRSLYRQIITNPFELEDDWLLNFVPQNIGVEINRDNKKETFETLVSEIFCLNSVHIFENTYDMIYKVLNIIYRYDEKKFKEYVKEYVKQQQQQQQQQHKQYQYILDKFESGKLNSLNTIGLLGCIINDELIENSKEVKVKEYYNLNPISFLQIMRDYRNSIVHSNGIFEITKDKKRYLYNFKELDDNSVLLMLDFHSIKLIVEAYKQVIYVIYKALNLKYNKKDFLNITSD